MAEGYEKIELKMPLWLVAVIGGGAVVATVALLYFALQPTITVTVRTTLMLAIALYLLTDAAMVYYFLQMRVTTSGSGVTYHRPFNSRSVPWDAVASYAEVFQATGNGKVIQLRNREGAVTLSFPAFLGSASERKRLLEVLDWHCQRMTKR
jgi:hypothetical protein